MILGHMLPLVTIDGLLDLTAQTIIGSITLFISVIIPLVLYLYCSTGQPVNFITPVKFD